MITKTKPDKQKAKALYTMAKITLERLNQLDITKYPTNSLNDYYDIIHKLLEALATMEGVKTQSEGAHHILIDYTCKQHQLSEATRIFLQELRDYRNRISYEGFSIKVEYIAQNKERINTIIKQLSTKIEQQLQ